MDALDSLAFFFGSGNHEGDVNPADDKHAFFGFDFSIHGTGRTAFVRGDSARCQRTGKGAEHSTAGGGHDVVECRGMRFGELIVGDAVVACNGAVDAEIDGLGLAGKSGDTQRAFSAFDVDGRAIDNRVLVHGCVLLAACMLDKRARRFRAPARSIVAPLLD